VTIIIANSFFDTKDSPKIKRSWVHFNDFRASRCIKPPKRTSNIVQKFRKSPENSELIPIPPTIKTIIIIEFDLETGSSEPVKPI